MKKILCIVGTAALMVALMPNTSLGQVDIDVNADAGVDIVTETNATASARSDERDERDDRGEGNEERVRTELRVNAAGIPITNAAQVQSEEDLDIFSSNLTAEEEAVAKVDITSETDGGSTVEVVYKHRGRLFGFISITLQSSTIVETKSNADVEIRAKMPWWAFLIAKEGYSPRDLEMKLRANTTIQENAMVNASAEAKAKVAEAIIAEVRASADVDVDVE